MLEFEIGSTRLHSLENSFGISGYRSITTQRYKYKKYSSNICNDKRFSDLRCVQEMNSDEISRSTKMECNFKQ